MKRIVCRVDNQGLAFSARHLVTWAATNLPPGAFKFSVKEPGFWELRMLAFSEGELKVEVLDFKARASDFQPDRVARATVHRVLFEPLDYHSFLDQLAYYRLADLVPVLTDSLAEATVIPPDFSEFGVVNEPVSSFEPLVNRLITFRYPFADLTIRNGYVLGEVELPEAPQGLAFRVYNDILVAEFEAIKSFFPGKLKRKTIEVKARLSNHGARSLRLIDCQSPQISAIDDSMIELFRVRSLRKLVGASQERLVDKQLFTPEDLLATLEDDEAGRALLPADGRSILDSILASLEVRNAKQLTFLARELQSAEKKLRFVLSPKFGFVFIYEGRQAIHFVLELLNDHATYVWSIPEGWGSYEEQCEAIESELAKISDLGRNQYRRLLSFEHEFWLVVHEQSEGSIVEGFPRWRARLLAGLV